MCSGSLNTASCTVQTLPPISGSLCHKEPSHCVIYCLCPPPPRLSAAGLLLMSALAPPLLHKGSCWFRLVERTPLFCPSPRPSLPPCPLLRWDLIPGSWPRSPPRRSCGTAPPSRGPARPHPGCRISRRSAAPARPTTASLLMQRCLPHRDK